MNCPHCGHNDSKVLDSRDVDDGVRRRRQCLRCDWRFTTYERIQKSGLFVVKKDKRRENFDKGKILNGLRKACEKRPVASVKLQEIADVIEADLQRQGLQEIPSTAIGDMVMAKLKDLDHIAYIRFASIYREFADITMLKQEVDSLAIGLSKSRKSSAQLPLITDDYDSIIKTDIKK